MMFFYLKIALKSLIHIAEGEYFYFNCLALNALALQSKRNEISLFSILKIYVFIDHSISQHLIIKIIHIITLLSMKTHINYIDTRMYAQLF